MNAENRDAVRGNADQLKLMNFGVIFCTLFRKSILDEYDLRFSMTEHEDTIYIYIYVSHCDCLRKIFYEGYFHFLHGDSQGHSHKYIAEWKVIANIDSAFHAVLIQFGITDEKLVDVFRNRLRAAIRSYLLKGIYKDTRVNIVTELSRWRKIAHTHFLILPYKGSMSSLDRLFGIMLKIMGVF